MAFSKPLNRSRLYTLATFTSDVKWHVILFPFLPQAALTHFMDKDLQQQVTHFQTQSVFTSLTGNEVAFKMWHSSKQESQDIFN